MKYFKTADGNVFAFDESDAGGWAEEGMVEMTAKEIKQHLNPPEPVLSKDEIEACRLRAYAQPLTGSDRLFSEAMRMQIMSEEGYEHVRAHAIARFEAIQSQYPWPVDPAIS